MKKLKSNVHTLDRLSALPDSLILEILSLMYMRDVVRTTLLSKRWKYLWITIPCLQFEVQGDPVKIRNFVSRVLALWGGTHLRKFSIYFDNFSCVPFPCSTSSDIDFWVLFAKERKVEELCIDIFCYGFKYCPPQCLYEISSLRKLNLAGCNLQIRGTVQWDRLNSLHLSSCLLSDDAIDQVFSTSSSPQLETFTSFSNVGFQNLSIRSNSLKKLSIFSNLYDVKHVLTIWAPNVKALKVSGPPFSKCLLSDVSSLTDVNLNFINNWAWDPELCEALCGILPAIQHVATVKLSDDCLKILGDMKGQYLFPPLLNVKLFSIGRAVTKLGELFHFLEIFPKLKMLLVDWNVDPKDTGALFTLNARNYIMSSKANILKSNLLQLRTVEITFYSYKASLMLQFIEFLLKHATMIEKIVIQKGRCSVVESEDVSRRLLTLQRSFSSVELIFL